MQDIATIWHAQGSVKVRTKLPTQMQRKRERACTFGPTTRRARCVHSGRDAVQFLLHRDGDLRCVGQLL